MGAPKAITRSPTGKANKKLASATIARNLEFGRRLSAIMLKAKMRQARLAELLGIQRFSVSDYANGKNIPHGPRLERICTILNCKIADLVPAYGAENGPPYTIQSEEDGTVWLTINHAVARMASFEEASRIITKLGLLKG